MDRNDTGKRTWNLDPAVFIQRLAQGRNTENWHKTGHTLVNLRKHGSGHLRNIIWNALFEYVSHQFS
jgi:hypothetical protein